MPSRITRRTRTVSRPGVRVRITRTVRITTRVKR